MSKMFAFSSLKSGEGMLGLGSHMCFPNHLLVTEGHPPSAHRNCVQPTVSQLNISGSQSYLPESAIKGQVKQSRGFWVRDPFILPGPTALTDHVTAWGAESGLCQPLENQLQVYFNARKTMKTSPSPPAKNLPLSG